MPSSLLDCQFVEGVDYRVVESGCWEWLGAADKFGYGLCYVRKYGERRAARAAYAQVHGPIPPRHHIHHKCKHPPCINPDHLQQLTGRAHFLLHKLTEQTGLTLDDVRDIRQLGRTAGVRARDVAEQYGIHEITVFNYWGQEQVWADLLNDEPMTKPLRTCPQCGGEFSERYRNAVYCSIPCRVEFNKERANERRRARRAERRAA